MILHVVLLTSCAPISSSVGLYSFKEINASNSTNSYTQEVHSSKDHNLKNLVGSMACESFESTLWNYIYQSVTTSQPLPPYLFKKNTKSYIKQYVLKNNPKMLRKLSNDLNFIYNYSLQFFSDKSESLILKELNIIESIRHSSSSSTPPAQLIRFFNHVQSKIQDISQLSISLQLPCLQSSNTPSQYITLPSGMNMFEIAHLLEKRNIMSKQEFLRECRDLNLIHRLLGERLESVEGYLYAGSYAITAYTTPSQLIEQMVKKFLTVYQEISRYFQSSLSRHQIVTLASMVEKEAVLDSEKPTIASVFHNRLKINMKLQSDPTVSYGLLRVTGSMPKKLRRRHLKIKTPYNTYTVKGFPKGPITNPDRHSLISIFKPRNTPYYYFVSKNGRTHIFSTNYENHKRAIRQSR